MWERSDFITVNQLISKKRTCIVHGNELISKMKSSNRLGFFSMARYGHPAVGKKFITSENVFTFFKYFLKLFLLKMLDYCLHLMFCPRCIGIDLENVCQRISRKRQPHSRNVSILQKVTNVGCSKRPQN